MRARFWIKSVTREIAGRNDDGTPTFYGKVEAVAVTRQTGDANWAHYTPVGSLTMTVSSEALDWWLEHQGEDVYLDLTPVPAGADA